MLALDTPIPTPSGWTTMGEISEGDLVFDERGAVCRVTHVFPIVEGGDAYRLRFDDGSSIVACADHRWITCTAADPSGAVRSTREIADSLLTPRGRRNHSIPVAGALDLPDAALHVDPYVLGVWLGRGVTSADDGDVHIPAAYLRASHDQRLALLAGLLDTDSGACEYTTVSRRLAYDVADLVHGLGWKARITMDGKDCGEKYRIKWMAPRRRYIEACDRVESVPMRCISVDSPSRLYLAGDSMVPTHNSDALIVEALRDVAHPSYHGLLLRRTFPRLQEIIDRCYRMYPDLGGIYRSTEHRWYFPSGAKITLGHMQHENDKYDYQGKEYQLVGFDELTQFTESQYIYLHSRSRSAVDGLRPRVRATTNPGGIGHMWVKQRFIDIAKAGETHIDPNTGLSRCFIPASVYDNPILMAADPAYIARLESLPKTERRRLLDGDWSIFDGQAFAELSQAVHGCEPFDIPDDWERFCVLDWGYSKPFSVGWYAVDYDGVLYRYREWYGCKPGEVDMGLRLTAQEVAQGILDMERMDRTKTKVRIADPSIYNRTAGMGNRRRETVGGSVAEDMQALGLHWLRADNDRIQGIQQVHKRFSCDEHVSTDTGEVTRSARFFVFNNCNGFWRTVPMLISDESNPEDVDTSMEDHCYDEVRYAAMYKPVRPRRREQPKSGTFRSERSRLARAKQYASRTGCSIEDAYRMTR